MSRSTFKTACSAALASVCVAAACMHDAWAQQVIVTQPAPAPSTGVTVVTAPPAAETKQVTVIQQPVTERHIIHEAVTDIDGDRATSIIVRTAPPELKQEVVRVETRPADNYTWVAGYWRWDTDRNVYEWVPGTWRQAPPEMTWIAGHWEKVDDGYQWVSGYWAKSPDEKLAVITEAPPPLRIEERTKSPGEGYIWVGGHWQYRDGKYVWSPGNWERPIREGMIWVPGRWTHTTRGYIYIGGHWDYPEGNRAYVASNEADTPADTVERDQERREEAVGPREPNR